MRIRQAALKLEPTDPCPIRGVETTLAELRRTLCTLNSRFRLPL